MSTSLRLDPWAIWNKLGYTPHKAQRRVHRSAARHRVVAAGRRFGKTKIGGAELDVEARRTRYLLPKLHDLDYRREFWIVGPEYTDSEKEFRLHYNSLKSAGAPMDHPGTYYDAHSGDMQLSMYQGKYLVIGKSAHVAERLVGEGLHGVIMAEAAKMKEEVWTKYIRATLTDYAGWSLHTSSTEGKNWFYQNWLRGNDPNNAAWQSWRMPSWLNPHVYPHGGSDAAVSLMRAWLGAPNRSFDFDHAIELFGLDKELAELVRDLTAETFDQEIGAQFSNFTGRVFKDFNEELHVRDLPYNPTWPTFAAVDYGFTNPFVWLLIQVDPMYGTVHVLDELYKEGLTIDEAAKEIDAKGLCPGGLRVFYPDPASPGDTRALARHLKIRPMGGTGGEINDRIRLIRAALKDRNMHLPMGHELRHPKLLFNRGRTTRTVNDFLEYRYPKTRSEQDTNSAEKPMKKDDHGPEALGRFYIGHFGKAGKTSDGRKRRETVMSR